MKKRKILDLSIDFNNDTKNFEMKVETINQESKEILITTGMIDYSVIMKILNILENLELYEIKLKIDDEQAKNE